MESILIVLRNQKKMDFEKKSHPIFVLLQNQISKKMAYVEKTGGFFHKYKVEKRGGFFHYIRTVEKTINLIWSKKDRILDPIF